MINLWDLYSFTYDSLAILPSYKNMINNIIKALEITEKEKYLDLGCGTGNLALEIVKRYNTLEISIYGLDFSNTSLLIANKKIKNLSTKSKPHFFLYDVRKGLPFPSSYFDGVSLVQLINYFPKVSDVIKLMGEVNRVTKKNGKIVIVSVARPHKFIKGSLDFRKALQCYPLKTIKNVPFFIANAFFNLPMKLGKNIKLYDEKCLEKIGEILKWKKEYSQSVYYNDINILVKFKK